MNLTIELDKLMSRDVFAVVTTLAFLSLHVSSHPFLGNGGSLYHIIRNMERNGSANFLFGKRYRGSNSFGIHLCIRALVVETLPVSDYC